MMGSHSAHPPCTFTLDRVAILIVTLLHELPEGLGGVFDHSVVRKALAARPSGRFFFVVVQVVQRATA
eukprot:COSAG05_NODE_13509_length_427_cov_0.932927_1_plen_67_part_10